jgi:hypothetical protein
MLCGLLYDARMMILKAILLTTVLVPTQVDEPTETTAPETTTTTVAPTTTTTVAPTTTTTTTVPETTTTTTTTVAPATTTTTPQVSSDPQCPTEVCGYAVIGDDGLVYGVIVCSNWCTGQTMQHEYMGCPPGCRLVVQGQQTADGNVAGWHGTTSDGQGNMSNDGSVRYDDATQTHVISANPSCSDCADGGIQAGAPMDSVTPPQYRDELACETVRDHNLEMPPGLICDEPTTTTTTVPATTTTTSTTTVPAQTTSSQQTEVQEPAEEQSTTTTATYVSEPPQEGPYDGLY